MIVGGNFRRTTLSPRSLSPRLRRRRGQRVALLAQLADDGRERRGIDLRSARLSERARPMRMCRGARVSCKDCETFHTGTPVGRTPWSQSRVSTSSAGRPRSASRRSDISCTAAWGVRIQRGACVRRMPLGMRLGGERGRRAPSRVAAGRPSFASAPRILDRDTPGVQAEVRMMNYRKALASRANVTAVKLAARACFHAG